MGWASSGQRGFERCAPLIPAQAALLYRPHYHTICCKTYDIRELSPLHE